MLVNILDARKLEQENSDQVATCTRLAKSTGGRRTTRCGGKLRRFSAVARNGGRFLTTPLPRRRVARRGGRAEYLEHAVVAGHPPAAKAKPQMLRGTRLRRIRAYVANQNTDSYPRSRFGSVRLVPNSPACGISRRDDSWTDCRAAVIERVHPANRKNSPNTTRTVSTTPTNTRSGIRSTIRFPRYEPAIMTGDNSRPAMAARYANAPADP